MSCKESKKSVRTHFPLFVDCDDKSVLVVGGGKIGERRIKTLLQFAFNVTLISPSVTDVIKQLCDDCRLRYEKRQFREKDIDGAFIVLACTDDRRLNMKIGSLCKKRGIFASVCDSKDESTFWFPAIIFGKDLTVGAVGDGSDHRITKNAAEKLRNALEER